MKLCFTNTAGQTVFGYALHTARTSAWGYMFDAPRIARVVCDTPEAVSSIPTKQPHLASGLAKTLTFVSCLVVLSACGITFFLDMERERQRRAALKASGKTAIEIQSLERMRRIHVALTSFGQGLRAEDRKAFHEMIEGTELEIQMRKVHKIRQKEYRDPPLSSIFERLCGSIPWVRGLRAADENTKSLWPARPVTVGEAGKESPGSASPSPWIRVFKMGVARTENSEEWEVVKVPRKADIRTLLPS